MVNPFGSMNFGQTNLLGQQNPLAQSGLFGQQNPLTQTGLFGQQNPLAQTGLLGQQNPLAMLGLDGSGLNGSGTDLMTMLQMLLAMVSPGMNPMMASGTSPMFGGGEAGGNPYENFLGGGGGGGTTGTTGVGGLTGVVGTITTGFGFTRTEGLRGAGAGRSDSISSTGELSARST